MTPPKKGGAGMTPPREGGGVRPVHVPDPKIDWYCECGHLYSDHDSHDLKPCRHDCGCEMAVPEEWTD